MFGHLNEGHIYFFFPSVYTCSDHRFVLAISLSLFMSLVAYVVLFL